jgi:hypothetical protein
VQFDGQGNRLSLAEIDKSMESSDALRVLGLSTWKKPGSDA